MELFDENFMSGLSATKKIKKTITSCGRVVSTVLLCNGNYETMVFPEEGNFLDIGCQHDYLREDALCTHRKFVKKHSSLTNGLDN